MYILSNESSSQVSGGVVYIGGVEIHPEGVPQIACFIWANHYEKQLLNQGYIQLNNNHVDSLPHVDGAYWHHLFIFDHYVKQALPADLLRE